MNRFFSIMVIFLVGVLITVPAGLKAQESKEKRMLDKAKELTYEGQIKHAQDLLTAQESQAGEKVADIADGWDSTSLMFGILWGAIGSGYALYGKKMANPIFLFCGLLLIFFPMFVTNNTANLILGVVLTVIPFKASI